LVAALGFAAAVALTPSLVLRPACKKRHVLACEWLCRLGDAGACAELGARYLVGDGVPADAARAAELSRRACDRGIASACENLGC